MASARNLLDGFFIGGGIARVGITIADLTSSGATMPSVVGSLMVGIHMTGGFGPGIHSTNTIGNGIHMALTSMSIGIHRTIVCGLVNRLANP